MKYQLQYLTRQIKAADSVPALLTSAFIGLEAIERATTVLPDLDTDQTGAGQVGIDHDTAIGAAIDAWWALSQAPTLAWPNSTPSTTGQARELAEAIAAFVLVVAEAILTAASKSTDPDDRVACLQAAHHAGRLQTALK